MCDLKKALFITCPKLSLSGSALHSLACSWEVQQLDHFNLEVACLDLRLVCQFWMCAQQLPPVLLCLCSVRRQEKVQGRVWQSTHLGAASLLCGPGPALGPSVPEQTNG